MYGDPGHSAMRETVVSAQRPKPSLSILNGQSLRSFAAERICEAATAAVVANGLDGLNMEDIAVRAGCSRATVYRRVGGKEAIRDAVLGDAVARITAAVTQAVDHLDGEERVVGVIIASLHSIRADPVSAALLTGPATAETVSSALVTEFTGTVAQLAGLDLSDTVACELITRVTLSLLCWPAVDRRTELAIIRRRVSPPTRA